MKRSSSPDVVELDVEELEGKLRHIEQELGEETARPFRMLLSWYLSLLQLIQQKNASIARLRRLLFGARTERTRNILNQEDTAADPESASAGGAHEGKSLDSASSAEDPGSEAEGGCDGSRRNSHPDGSGRRRRPNHGRIPASAYTGCQRVVVKHERFEPGDLCPHCQEGILYRLGDWSQVVRLKGQSPVGGTRYELERLRCGLCGKVQTAELPEEAGDSKYDATVVSVIATLRYGQGMPWNRIQQMQQAAGVPLPASVQWELVRDALERGPGDVYQWLLQEAAQGDLLHNDDTHMRVLEVSAKLRRGEPVHEDDPQRRGVFTTNILSVAEGRPIISLFFTGTRHAGENLHEVLAKRMADLPPPTQMCDALSRNLPGELETIVAHCLSHGRRNFYELADIFPSEVRYILRCLRIVYRIDERAKRKGLSPEERLRLHQSRSGPVMQHLHQWLQGQLDEHKVEPNSSLGKAITYMLKHWERLTLFLRQPAVPLDNNICEQALKMAIRHRKNSLFYRTLHGAHVGDVYMTLIHTCYHSQVDPLDYLTQLQRHHEQVAASTGDWLPWNYREQLQADRTSSSPI